MVLAEKSYLDPYRSYGPAHEQVQKRAKQLKKSKKKEARKIARMLIAISIFCAIGFVIVLRYTMLTELTNNIYKQNKYLSSLDKTNSQIRAEMIVDLNTVDDIAKGRLGMDRPNKNQTVYVNLDNVENDQLAMDVNDNKSDSVILKKLSKIVEYLY